ncbi:transposase/IS protein [Oxobacter pfennigii]|uniref:Transposase/IS protein n=1 Tax=Oxobacter pfennigii TaxID=36849 RepID=A0A0P8W9S0_9CLOT|nr:transposase/IS protein [Oxobacter pfennigii]
MIRQVTIDKLHDLRLSAMADAFEAQCKDQSFVPFSFEDRFGMLVDKEWDKRKNTKLQKLIHIGDFRHPNACMEDIEYHVDRKLDKAQMLEFSTCRYISANHHIILKGASGNGKTYIACALGIAACRNFIKVRYIRLPDLLNELAVAHGEGTFEKVIKTYQRIDLLILDEFLLTPLASDQARELLEIIEA